MICKLDSSYMQSLHILFSIAERSSFMAYHFVWILIRYYSIQKLKGKSDVYSFGAVLLELISGRKPVIRYGSDLGIVHWLKKRKNQMENHKVKEALKHPICQACYDKEISREMHQNSMLKKEHKRLYEMLFPNTMGWGGLSFFCRRNSSQGNDQVSIELFCREEVLLSMLMKRRSRGTRSATERSRKITSPASTTTTITTTVSKIQL